MANYLQLGFNNDLLRPVESQYVEQIGIDSSSGFGQIRGSQVFGDTIFSKNKNIALDLENGVIRISNGAADRFSIGLQEDGSIGLVVKDDSGIEIGRIDNNGINFKQGKMVLENTFGQNVINSQGLVSSSFLQAATITKKTQQTIGGTAITPVNDLQVSFKSSTLCFGIFIALVSYGIGGKDDTMRMRFKIDDALFSFTGDQTSWSPFNPETDISRNYLATICTINSFNPGSHLISVEAFRSSGTETYTIYGQSTGDVPSTFSYCLFGRND